MNAPTIHRDMQIDMQIVLDGDEFDAVVTYNDLIDSVEATRVLFNVVANFWAVLEPEHYGLIDEQLTAHLIEQGAQAKTEQQIERIKSRLPYFLTEQAD